MRTRGAIVTTTAWLVATGLGIAVSWLGLRSVLDTAVPDRSVPLSAADLRHLSPSMSPPPASPTPSPTAAPSATGPSPSYASSPPRQTASPSPRPTIIDGWTVVSEGGGTAYLRSFRTNGGDAAIKMVPGKVSLVSATPKPGFQVATDQNQPERLLVRFIAGNRVSTIDALWWQDHPTAQVTEAN